MKRPLILAGMAVLALTATLAVPASADPPRHSHGYYRDRHHDRGYSGDRYRRGYSDYNHDRHDRYDHGYGSRYYGRGYGRAYGGNAYRHNDHPAERKKWTHGGRHVIDRKHGHHR